MINTYCKRLTLLLLLVLLPACGGGGGDNTPPDTTVPTANLVPAHSSSNVDSTTNIVATFNEDMFASTINANNFTLRGTGDNIDATVSFDALSNIATLNPNTTLGFLKTYTARLKPGITDLSGNALALTKTTFTTRDGSWNGPASLLDGASGGDSDRPEVAVSPNGNAIVVFEKLDGAVSNIYANHYSVNNGWSGPVRLDGGNDDSRFPQVAIDAKGNAVAVWIQGASVLLSDVYASRYTAASGWGPAEIIDNDTLPVLYIPKIAMDPAGNADVVWVQFVNATDIAVKVNNYNSSTGNWGTANNVFGSLPQPVGFLPIPLNVTIGSDGTRIISWIVNDRSLFATVTPANATQSYNLQININISEVILYHQTVVDSKGNATIVWQETAVGSQNTYARYFSAGGTSWSDATLLDTTTVFSFDPSLAVDPAGNVIAVWVQHDGTRFNVWANRFSNFLKAWGTAELIEEAAGTVSRFAGTADGIEGAVKIAAADVNTFSAIWNQANDSGDFDVWTNRYTRNGWGTAEMLESSSGDTKHALVDFDSNGNGIAVWIQMNGGRDAVLARHFN